MLQYVGIINSSAEQSNPVFCLKIFSKGVCVCDVEVHACMLQTALGSCLGDIGSRLGETRSLAELNMLIHYSYFP